MTWAPRRHRVCAICGKWVTKSGQSTWGFKAALRELKHPNWEQDKAHPECIRKFSASLTAKGANREQ